MSTSMKVPRLRTPQVRVLAALLPKGGGTNLPLLTREELAARAGFNRGSGTINRALRGIRSGSSSGKPHKGLLALCFVKQIGGMGRNKQYQITAAGISAIKQHPKLPKMRDKEVCINLRYLLGEAAEESHSSVQVELNVGAENIPADEGYTEGRELLSLHRRKERNRKAVQRKKSQVQAAEGKLSCEVCDFDFVQVYGSLGEGFAECHHRTPIAKLTKEYRIRLSELAIVCANCHRMFHRRSLPSVESLRIIVMNRRAEKKQRELEHSRLVGRRR